MQCGRSSGSRVPTRSPLGSPDSSLTVTSSRTQRGAAQRACDEATSRVAGSRILGCTRRPRGAPSWRRSFIHRPSLNRVSTVRHHGPIDLSAELMPPSSSQSRSVRTVCRSIRLRGPRSASALRHARRPCALTRGRPGPGTGRRFPPPLSEVRVLIVFCPCRTLDSVLADTKTTLAVC
jgi:hypothetical protein